MTNPIHESSSTAAPEVKVAQLSPHQVHSELKNAATALFKKGVPPAVVADVLLSLAVQLGVAQFGHAGMTERLRAAASRTANQAGL